MQKTKKAGRPMFWVVQQHEDFNVIEAVDRPDTKVEKGERAKSVSGPFATRADAEVRAEQSYGRTLKGMTEKASI